MPWPSVSLHSKRSEMSPSQPIRDDDQAYLCFARG
jgi:hypothetical protein